MELPQKKSMVFITNKKIDSEEMIRKVTSSNCGAISTFLGITRNYTGAKKVKTLFYEAYTEMALKVMEEIGEDTKQKFPIENIAIIHRIGEVPLEEASIMIAVSAGHRKESIEACHYAIDRVKAVVPIWKKEFFEEGEPKWIANQEAV